MEKRSPAEPARFEMCPVCRTLELLGGKWRLPAIWQLHQGKSLHYNELKRRLDGVTNIMLTRVLKALEEEGLVRRTVVCQTPPRVEYSLTERCDGLLPAFEIIYRWGSRYLCDQDGPPDDGMAARTFEMLGGKWRLAILWQLFPCKSMRYNELKRHLPGITNAMLTRALQALQEHDLIERVEFSCIPPHVEYSLTERCAALLPSLEIISEWGKEQLIS